MPVEVIRALHQAFDRGEFEAVFELIDEHVEWEEPPGFPDRSVQFGHEGMRRSWGRWLADWESYEIDIDEYIDAGDRVVVVGSQRGKGRTTGIEVSRPYASVFTVRDGKVVCHQAFMTKAEALAALG